MDTFGRITVPVLVDSGLTFGLTSDTGYGFSQDRPIVAHRFGELDAKAEQRFAVGIGPRKFAFRRQQLSASARNTLVQFWEALQGPWKSFTYNFPNADQSTTATKVTWEYAPFTLQYLVNACQTGFNFIEVPEPTAAPVYAVASTCVRFPSNTLQAALLSQVQQIIPLIHIRVREQAVPDIYLSDRRCTVGGQLYLPRVLGLGEPGSDVILSQDIKGTADSVQFTFGNADRVMSQLANDTDLKFASIDLSLYHVNTGILLQLWAGFITTFAVDGGPHFVVRASDGLYQLTQAYPVRVVSRTCWKLYNDSVNCKWATQGANAAAVLAAGGDPGSCDYYFDSANGCKVHGMTASFGGHPAAPQGVMIKDNSTGLWGIGRNTVTAVSIISDTIWGNALQEIWCNDDGDPGKAFWVSCMIAAGRDEGDYYDALGVVGAGPIGQYTGMMVYQNADGYRYIIAPMLDNQPPQGFKVDGGLNVITNNPAMGLREVAGNDPVDTATDSFSLGNGTPQVWGPQMAAGTAFVEIRRAKASGISPTTTESHEMRVPVSKGLAGWTWDAAGNRTAVAGLSNPFWVAVNSFLRALGVFSADSATQLVNIVLPSIFAGDGTGAAEIADTAVAPLVGTGTEKQFRFQGVLAQQKPFRDWLVEILACALGYFTFEFGKLKLGCRINASATDAFTIGNILFQSLRLEPIEASFEQLTIEFADQAYQYAANTAPYFDKSHAQYYGRAGAPLAARQHLVGCGAISQALRLAAVRTREEIGGVTPAEWRNARRATWQTTILALGTEVGQVVSMSHPDVPGLRGTCNAAGAVLTWVSGDQFDSSMLNKEMLIAGQQVVVASVSALSSVQTMWWQGNPAYNHSVTIGANTYSAAEGTLSAAGIARNIAIQINQNDPVCQATMAGLYQNEIVLTLRTGQTGPVVVSSSDGSAGSTIAAQITLASAPGDGACLAFQIITGDFRIESWRLKKDWSIEIGGKTVTPSMYDLTTGPKPADVIPSPMPGMFYAIPIGPAWAPYQVQAPANDALFPGEWNFDADQTYTTLADGSALVALAITGKLSVNQFSPGVGSPVIGSITQAAVGGSIPGGVTLRMAICALDANGLPSRPSAIAIVQTAAGSNTNQITLRDITWPAVVGLATYAVFVSTQDDLICEQQADVLVAGGGGTTYTPGSITINGPFARSTWAIPSPYVSKVRVKAKRLVHGGVIGTVVISVAGNNVVCSELIDSHVPAFDPTGRVLSVIGRPESSTPFISFTITAFDHTTGTLTVTPAPTTGGHPELSIQAGDVVVVRFKPDAGNAGNPTQITDSGCLNVTNAYGGLTPGEEVGNVLRVIQGTGRGQLRKVTANTTTQVSWDLPLVLDATSAWIIEPPAWDYTGDSTAIENADSLRAVTLNIPAANYVNVPMLIAGFTVDTNGNESPDGDVPIREDWIYGTAGQRSAGFVLTVPFTLGIQADAAPAFYLNNDFVAGAVKAYVKQAPTGADLTFTVYAGVTAWIQLNIAAGSTSVVAASTVVDALTTIPANTTVRLAITAVGTTSPGSELSVFVYS